MNLSQDCRAFQHRLDELLDHRREPNSCAEIRRHVADCPRCRARLDLQRAILDALASSGDQRTQDLDLPTGRCRTSDEAQVVQSRHAIAAGVSAPQRPRVKRMREKLWFHGVAFAGLVLLAVFLQLRTHGPRALVEGGTPRAGGTSQPSPSYEMLGSHPRVSSRTIQHAGRGQAEPASLPVGWWPAAIASSSVVWNAESVRRVERSPAGQRLLPDLLDRTANEWGVTSPDQMVWIDQAWFVPVRGGLAPLTQTVASTLNVLRATVLNGPAGMQGDKRLAIEGA